MEKELQFRLRNLSFKCTKSHTVNHHLQAAYNSISNIHYASETSEDYLLKQRSSTMRHELPSDIP